MDNLRYPGSLHNHTEYSNLRLRDSINRVDDMLNYAEELGHKVIALQTTRQYPSWVKIEKGGEEAP